MIFVDSLKIFQVILSIISIIITGVLIPLIKSKVSKDKIDKAMTITAIAVKAAEQIYRESGQGKEKKDYVKDYLKKSKLKLTDEEIDTLIEAAVKELNLWQEEVSK